GRTRDGGVRQVAQDLYQRSADPVFAGWRPVLATKVVNRKWLLSIYRCVVLASHHWERRHPCLMAWLTAISAPSHCSSANSPNSQTTDTPPAPPPETAGT